MKSAVMKKTMVGTVTPEESDAIRALFERRNGLLELFKALIDMDTDQRDLLYEKIVRDFSDVTARYQDWWTEKSLKYGWENSEGKRWEVNFTSCEVFIIDSNNEETPRC